MPCAGHGYSTGGAGSHHRSRLRGRPRGNGKRAIKGGDAVLPSGNWSIKATVFIAPAIVIVLMLATVVVFDQAMRPPPSSAERRVGHECGCTCRFRCSPY